VAAGWRGGQLLPTGPYVTGVYHFDRRHGLLVGASLTRDVVEFPIQLCGTRGLVSLPELRPGAFGRPRLVTPPLIRRGATVGWGDGRGPSTRWGWSLADRWDQAQQVFVRMLAMRFPQPDARLESATEVADALFESIGEWSRRLEDWLDVSLNEDRADTASHPLVSKTTERMHQVVDRLELKYVDEARTVSKLLAYLPPYSIDFLPQTPLVTETWSRILDHANAGREPPNERILLRDSRVQLAENHNRRAVLDAATAAELALTLMLDEILSGLPRSVGELIRRGARQLGPLAETLQRLGTRLPASFRQDLVEVRNQVIHAGYEPSTDMARRTVQLAHDLVEQARPLDRVLAPDDPHD
jgi:hypothetical protein